MQTSIVESFLSTPDGKNADAILRKCVHCGFCTATCPTYQLLGDELDSPRGRIYLIKEMLEGATVTSTTQTHLDRCLTCRACETTCPSGVEYGNLVEIGRREVERRVSRGFVDRLKRRALVSVIPNPKRFSVALKMGRLLKPMMPRVLRNKIPDIDRSTGAWPTAKFPRRMIVLDGCAQSVLRPSTNVAAARVLEQHGVALERVPEVACCGAVALHTSAENQAFETIKRNVDIWWSLLNDGVENLVMTASGCGVTVREYGHLLADDPEYAEKAAFVSARTLDISEVVIQFKLDSNVGGGQSVAYHPPCTLQHGQKIRGVVESILTQSGFEPVLPNDAHLCCGSAGTYSLLQSDIAEQLRTNKLAALSATGADIIASGNIGCITHLASASSARIHHWIELLDPKRAR